MHKPYLGKFNSFALVDETLISLELVVRGVECEFPNCENGAEHVLLEGWTVFLCKVHYVLHRRAPDVVIYAIASWNTFCMEQILEAALEGDHSILQYSGL